MQLTASDTRWAPARSRRGPAPLPGATGKALPPQPHIQRSDMNLVTDGFGAASPRPQLRQPQPGRTCLSAPHELRTLGGLHTSLACRRYGPPVPGCYMTRSNYVGGLGQGTRRRGFLTGQRLRVSGLGPRPSLEQACGGRGVGHAGLLVVTERKRSPGLRGRGGSWIWGDSQKPSGGRALLSALPHTGALQVGWPVTCAGGARASDPPRAATHQAG